jgi:hypothetical protein
VKTTKKKIPIIHWGFSYNIKRDKLLDLSLLPLVHPQSVEPFLNIRHLDPVVSSFFFIEKGFI